MNFLMHWQHATPERQLRGRDGILAVIEQLQGLEQPAPAWEQHILPARIAHYDPADLEHLCSPAWWHGEGCALRTTRRWRLAGGVAKKRRRLLAPARNAPIAFLLREAIGWFLESTSVRFTEIATLSAMALEVASYLDRSGASFLTDIARGTGLLKVKVEDALWQLVAHGLATGDGDCGIARAAKAAT
jgi:ATP-dependent Lhr-like helicase